MAWYDGILNFFGFGGGGGADAEARTLSRAEANAQAAVNNYSQAVGNGLANMRTQNPSLYQSWVQDNTNEFKDSRGNYLPAEKVPFSQARLSPEVLTQLNSYQGNGPSIPDLYARMGRTQQAQAYAQVSYNNNALMAQRDEEAAMRQRQANNATKTTLAITQQRISENLLLSGIEGDINAGGARAVVGGLRAWPVVKNLLSSVLPGSVNNKFASMQQQSIINQTHYNIPSQQYVPSSSHGINMGSGLFRTFGINSDPRSNGNNMNTAVVAASQQGATGNFGHSNTNQANAPVNTPAGHLNHDEHEVDFWSHV